MTEERAALLIADYANGLRHELALLGASEVNDLVSEVVAMLRDASAGDAGIAAVEIERLGPPADLARTVLEQHGFESGPGMQVASWWRLGIAAPLDIAVGLAAPVAASVLSWRVLTTFPGSQAPGDTSVIASAAWVLLCGALGGVALWLAWRYWRPWRIGGGEATAGMALAGIAVVTLGGTRSVVPTGDLARAGLAHPHRSKAGSALTVLLAAGLLGWAVMAVGSPVSSAGADVEVFAGDSAMQQRSARAVVEQLYADALDVSYGGGSDPGGRSDPDSAGVREALRKRALSGAMTAYRIVDLASLVPGSWRVRVAEIGPGGTRAVTVTAGLRVTWEPTGSTTPEWQLSGYESAGSAD